MRKVMRKTVIGIFAAGVLLALEGCAATSVPVVGNLTPVPTQTATPSPTQTPTPSATPIAIIMATPTPEATPIPVSLTPIAEAEDHLKTIGVKQEGEQVIKIKLVNSTGKQITDIRMIPMDVYEEEEDYGISSGNLLASGDIFTDKEERIFYYDTSTSAADEAGVKHYHLQLGFDDGSSYTLTDVPFAQIKEAVIYFNDDVAYLVYLSKDTGVQVSTKELEQQHLANRLEEEAARKQREEEEREKSRYYDEYDEDEEYYNEKEYEDEPYEDYTYDEDYDDERYDYDRYEDEYYDED